MIKLNCTREFVILLFIANLFGISPCLATSVRTLNDLQTVTTDTTTQSREADLTNDITVPSGSTIGTAGSAGAGTTLTINGNVNGTSYGINGAGSENNSAAWSVNSADVTLNIKNIGSYSSGTTVSKAIQNFFSTNPGSVLNISAGTVNINNSIIYNNASPNPGGAIYNSGGTVNIGTSTGTDTTSFLNNYTATGGGAIYNAGTLNIYNLSTFTGNNATVTSANSNPYVAGGAIYYYKTANIYNSTFTGNYVVGISTSADSNAYIEGDGGAICNDYSVTIDASTVGNIYNSTFKNNYVQVTASSATATGLGGAICNYTVSNIYDSIFSGNYVSALSPTYAYGIGGAIYSNTGTVNINNSTFSGNYVSASGTAGGGAVYNNGTANINNSTFTNNYSSVPSICAGAADGGAINNDIGATISIYNSVIKGNYTTALSENVRGTALGGAIFNGGTVNIYNSIFTGNYATIASTGTGFARGGAIYNDGNDGVNPLAILNIYNSSFTDNSITGTTLNCNGGAIYNYSGYLNLISDSGITSFTGNNLNGISNAIYIKNGMMNLNAGNVGYTIFNDKISGTSSSSVFVNQTGTGAVGTGYLESSAPTSGNVIFNDTVSNVKLTLKNGQLILGQYGNTHLTDASGVAIPSTSGTHTYLSSVALALAGGTLNTANAYLDTNNLSSLAITSGAKLLFDTDLSLASTANSDKFVVSGQTSGTLTIQGINIIHDDATVGDTVNGTIGLVSGGTFSSFGTTAINAYTNDYKYAVAASASNTTGHLSYTRTAAANGLTAAIADNSTDVSFSATSNVGALSAPLGTPQSSVLSLFGNGYGIDGNSKSGFTVSDNTHTINMYNFGSLDASGNAVNPIKNFTGNIFNIAGTTAGGAALNLYNDVFSNNNTTGNSSTISLSNTYANIYNSSFISNGNSTNMTSVISIGAGSTTNIIGSTFTSNISNYGGAINNNGGTIYLSDSAFINNAISVTGNSSTAEGGAIYNTGSTSSFVIMNATFKGNNTSSSGTSSRARGGAILNDTAASMTITGSSFTGNYTSSTGTNSADGGGAIYNRGNLSISSTNFSGNYGFYGGAINNNNILTIGALDSTDTTEFINNASTGNGGAICNNATVLNIYNGVTFTGNHTGTSGNGGAIYNTGSSAVATIDGTIFKYNGYKDYNATTGNTDSASGAVSTACGGAIYNYSMAKISITNSSFINNASTSSGGAILNSSTATNALVIGTSSSTDTTTFTNNQSTGGNGGAIANSGTLNIYNGVTFAGNYTGTSGLGGAIYNTGTSAVATIIGATFKYNGYSDYATNGTNASAVSTSKGGAIYNDSTYSGGTSLSISGSTFTNNAATSQGGAIWNSGGTTTHPVTICNSTFANNVATGASGTGGAIYNSGALTIGTSTGTDTTSFINNSSTQSRAGAIYNSGTLNIYKGVTFAGNYAAGYGGAIWNQMGTTAIDGATFKYNGYSDYDAATGTTKSTSGVISNSGGGAIISEGTSVSITNSNLFHNAVSGLGGAVYSSSTLNIGTSTGTDSTTFTNNYAGISGGGIANYKVLNIYSGVTFAGNYTPASHVGGAIYNSGSSAVATIVGATFKYNGYSDYNATLDKSLSGTAVSTQNGGAIYNDTSGKVSITNSKFNNNAATTYGGAIRNVSTVTNALNIGTSTGTDTTSFTNNKSTTSSGGAIFNTGILNIYSGVTFAGNYTGTSGNGGAIYNTGASEIATIKGATFKWNGYKDYDVTSDKSTGNAVSTKIGGAIYNDTPTKLKIYNTTFSNNAASSQGGALFNAASICDIGTSGSTDTTSFVNNQSTTTHGGAIFNTGILNSYSGVTYAGNYAKHNGGAVNNSGGSAVAKIIGNTFKYNGYSDYDVTTDKSVSGTAIASANGGAIFNDTGANLKISNTSFTNNAVTGNGGAIYNNAGATTYIQGDGAGKETLFQGNKAAGVSNAIYLAGTGTTTATLSNLFLNAGNSGKIVSYDGISGSNILFNNLFINSSNATAATSFIDGTTQLTSGEVDLYGDITGVTVTDYAGTTNFGDSTAPISTGYYNGTIFNLSGGIQNFYNAITGATITSSGGVQNLNSALTGSTLNVSGGTFNLASSGSIASSILNLNSGTLNLVNGKMDTVALTDFNANPAGTLVFDANLATGANDKITVSGTASGELKSSINITQEPTNITNAENATINLVSAVGSGNISGLTLDNTSTTYTNSRVYTFTGSNNGTYNVSMAWSDGLKSAVVAELAHRTFSATSDVTSSDNLGTMGQAGSTLDIYGNGHSIIGNGKSGIIVGSDQTLNVSGVGSASANTSVRGFFGANGAFIDNNGTTTITNSIFSSNLAQNGGVLYNESTGIVNVSGSTFKSNLASQSGGAIYNSSNLVLGNSGSTDTTSFIKNSATDGGAIYNSNTLTSNSGVTFAGNHSSADGGAIYNSGSSAKTTITSNTFNYNGFDDYSLTSNTASTPETQNGGAIYNTNGATLKVSNSTFSNNNAAVNGGAIYNDSTATIQNSTFTGNTAGTSGGAIYNKGTLNVIADKGTTSFTGNKANGNLNAIYLDSTSSLNLNAGNGGQITFNDKITSASNNNINVNPTGILEADGTTAAPTDGTVLVNNNIVNSNVNLYNGTLALGNDGYLNGNNLNVYGGTLNMINGAVGQMSLNTLALNSSANLKIDVDLANSTADKITANTVSGTGMLNVNAINLLSDSVSKKTSTQIADSNLASRISLNTTTAETPIYEYGVAYDNGGNLVFTGGLKAANPTYNPAILTSPVSASAGAYMSQVNVYNEILNRSELFMALPQTERLLMLNRNKYAALGGSDVQPEVFSPTFLPDDKAGLWFKEYTTFENIPLNNGPNVSNVGYGAIVGGDTPMTHLGHGCDGYLTVYAAYNGSHQNYDAVGTNQNGGALGITGTLYKGNFFTALTASVGDSYGQANTKYGDDNFNTILAGLAWKTGYNIELNQGKYILQPSFMTSYTFAKTFDYTTSSGVNITSDPLNTFQISPGLKFIYNAKDGWQPYLACDMVWNIMDAQKFYANDAQLPQMSIAPYVEYGLGVQRRWGDRFTGFGQVMFRGGGRNGVAFQFGFRYALGK